MKETPQELENQITNKQSTAAAVDLQRKSASAAAAALLIDLLLSLLSQDVCSFTRTAAKLLGVTKPGRWRAAPVKHAGGVWFIGYRVWDRDIITQ